MILSTTMIRERLRDACPPESRLVITPILDWEAQAKPGASAIDVRLGQRFRVPRRTKLDRLDHIHELHGKDLERYKDDYVVPFGDYFVLHPRQFVLGETLEWIHMPLSLAAYVIGRSSWGRDGLIIATATGVHGGYTGILTLELSNVGEIPIRLYPGLAIAQLFIHDLGQGEPGEIAASSFGGSTGPESGRAASKADAEIIRELRRRRGFPDPR